MNPNEPPPRVWPGIESLLQAAFSSPTSLKDLLEEVVKAAMGVVESQAGALFLLDQQKGDLVCRVSIGGSGDALLSIRVPVGVGIVGHVVATSDPFIANDPAGAFQNTPWKPRNLLCVPIVSGEQLVGALELCDRTSEGVPAPYTFADAHTLGHFAPVAAHAILLSQNLAVGVEAALRPTTDETTAQRSPRAVQLASLVGELLSYGDAEAETCYRLLESFLHYVRSTSPTPNQP